MTKPTKCPPLIAENVGEYDDLFNRITLERVAAAVIDSSWHYSSHWERDDSLAWRPISRKGWEDALQDGRTLLAGLEAHAQRIRDVLPLIEAEIARHKAREEDDSE